MSGDRLEGTVALITGVAQGIGKEIATVFAQEGAMVIVTDINDDLGKSVANEIGEKAVYFHLDVSLENDWKKVTAEYITGIELTIDGGLLVGASSPQKKENN